METQDHKNPNPSGNDGHGGGGHLCHKCGWAFPNAHPSSKNRRAHKKVCGTIDGYRLDNVGQGKGRVEGDVREPDSDDELKTPSEKVVERTISRRSSSGVGSKSGRSTRSEDEEFADADTEFNESPAILTRKASDGVLQRYYSMQNDNEIIDTKPAGENSAAGGDKLFTPDLLEDKLQAVQSVDGEKDKLEAGMGSQDHIFTSPLASAAVALESENAVDQNLIQSSKQSGELDIVSDGGKQIISSKDESDVRASCSGTPEEVAEEVSVLKGGDAEVKGVADELLDSVCSGLMKETFVETDGVENSHERLNDVYFPEKEKNESCNEGNSPGNIYPPSLQALDIDSGSDNTRKSDFIEEWDSKITANEANTVLPVPDVLPSQQHPEITVEDLDHEGGKFNFAEATDSMAESLEYSKACETYGNDRVSSEDSKTSVDEQNTFEEPDRVSYANSSNADINFVVSEVAKDLKIQESEESNNSCTAEKKPSMSLEKTFSEGVTMNADHIQETTSNGDFNAKEDGEYSTTLDNDGGEVSEDDFAVRTSMLAKPALDEVASQDFEPNNSRNYSGIGNIDGITVEADLLNGKEMSGGVLESLTTDTGPAHGSSVGGSYDSHDSKERNGKAEVGVLNKIVDSEDMMSAHSQGESLLTSKCGGETENVGENVRREEFVDDSDTGAVLVNDDHLVSISKLEVDDSIESSSQSLAVVNHCSSEKCTENTSILTEGNRAIKKDVTVPAVDTIVDSGSQTDSLDGNWGSVSVMSTTSDAQPTADTTALNHPRAADGEESLSFVPKPVMENQHSANQTLAKPEDGIKQKGHVSEIQTSKEQQHINSALQTGWTPTIANVANEPDRGKKDKEILAKVTNWDSGKQHSTPLKTLLGEATARSRAESPIHHNQSSSSTPVPQTDAPPATKNGFSAKTENTILNSNNPEMETAQEEAGKEWNSPARYPVNIKTEKRRTKSKPVWAPFFCCSSVNAR